jgi:hypothetical protein
LVVIQATLTTYSGITYLKIKEDAHMTEEDTHTADPTPGVEPDREYPGMPRWVKVSGLIVIGLVLLVVVVLLVATALGLHTPGGPGGHGLSRHIASGDAGGDTVRIEQEVQLDGPLDYTPPIEYGGQQL